MNSEILPDSALSVDHNGANMRNAQSFVADVGAKMKCHIGVDAGSGLVHTITVTAANAHDITQAAALIREDDEVVYGDSGYLGIQKRPEIRQNTHFSNIDFRINRRPISLSVGTNYVTIYTYIS